MIFIGKSIYRVFAKASRVREMSETGDRIIWPKYIVPVWRRHLMKLSIRAAVFNSELELLSARRSKLLCGQLGNSTCPDGKVNFWPSTWLYGWPSCPATARLPSFAGIPSKLSVGGDTVLAQQTYRPILYVLGQ